MRGGASHSSADHQQAHGSDCLTRGERNQTPGTPAEVSLDLFRTGVRRWRAASAVPLVVPDASSMTPMLGVKIGVVARRRRLHLGAWTRPSRSLTRGAGSGPCTVASSTRVRIFVRPCARAGSHVVSNENGTAAHG